MPGATLTDPGLTSWTDNVDNWRAADADYLQRRGNMRFATVGSRNTFLGSTPPAGMVAYIQSLDALQFTDAASGTSNVWRTILAPVNMAISDTGSSFGLRLASDGAASLALEASKVVLGPGRIVTVDTALRVKTGAATASLTTDATALVSDVQVKAPSAALTGALASASVAATGAITGASVAATGNISSATLNVSGVTTVAAVNGSGLVTLSSLEYLRSSTINGYQSWYSGGSRLGYLQGTGTGLALVSETGNLTLTGPYVVLAPSVSGPAHWGSAGGPMIACSVAFASDPGVGNYPDGTLWCQV